MTSLWSALTWQCSGYLSLATSWRPVAVSSHLARNYLIPCGQGDSADSQNGRTNPLYTCQTMLNDSTIALVGAGQMAEAIIGGLLNLGLPPKNLIASGPREERLATLTDKYGIRTTTNNAEAADKADFTLLTMKPQMAHEVLHDLKGKLSKNSVVISIAAGVTMDTIHRELSHELVARAMPNTPGKINKGITVWTTSKDVTDIQRAQIGQLLAALGEEVYVDHERYLDMATALSGTGPMYVFLFMEALVDAGVRMGLPRYMTERLVIQTTSGSAEYAKLTGQHLAQLRNDVTSPGGTSSEALFQLDQAGFRTALAKAVQAAYERSKELGAK